MSSPSNLYAEKVFAENPIALWPLDDTANFISLITSDRQSLSSWSLTGGVFSDQAQDIIDEPFQDSPVSLILGNVPNTSVTQVRCLSPNLVRTENLNKDLATFSIGAYIYADSIYLTSIEIGYEYKDAITGNLVEKTKLFSAGVSKKWMFVSETFNLPDDDADIRISIKLNYIEGGSDVNDYKFYINGISFGQWSEEFNATSLGIVKQEIPADINIPASFGIPAFSYGLQDLRGYYLVNDNSLVAKNSSVPMAYGSSGVTCISKNANGLPSLIIPGCGLLSESGKYNTYTAEFWLRIVSDTTEPKKIFGPIASDDGVYVNGPQLILKIGNNVGYHFVNEWGRPMLIDLRVLENRSALLINGEVVIELSFLSSEISFAESVVNGKDQDWLGFYSHEDISSFEIDCVAIYPYQVSETVAKRRFIYGQGVEFPENINTAYSGTTALIDYSFAEYSNSYNFPSSGSWQSGIVDNLEITNNVMSSPNYLLPTFFNSSQFTATQLYESLRGIQLEDSLFISLMPNSEWNLSKTYFSIDSINKTVQNAEAVYGVFKRKSINAEPQILFELKNMSTMDSLSVSISGDSIKYYVTYLGSSELVYEALGNLPGEKFAVGFNINNFSRYFGGKVAKVLGSLDQLSLYVGGSPTGDTFSGNIYSFGISNQRNFSKVSSLFNDRGLLVDYENVFNLYTSAIEYDAGNSVDAVGGYYDNNGNFIRTPQSYWDYFIDGGSPESFLSTVMSDHVASYTITPKIEFNQMSIDIATDSYWEDYVPLTYFAKYVNDAAGDKYYNLDFLQFNIGYPSPSKYIAEITTGSWDYADLQSEYSSPTEKNYEILANQLFTGYDNYDDLKNRAVKSYKYDTTSNALRSYISFQYLESGANAPYTYFTKTEMLPKNGVIQPSDDWMTTRYEVVDGAVIYPPSGVAIESLAIVIHLELVNLATKSNPIKIKSVQLAGQALNADSSNKIGTRFGASLFPYNKSGLYFDYKSKNPYSIYKQSNPYLHLTRNSGIKIVGDISSKSNRGISMPINSSKSRNYKVSAAQLMLRYDEDFFPYRPTEIFEIQGKIVHLKFFMVATHPSGKRARVYAVNANTGRIENGVGFYLNGKLVKEPTITVKEWAMIGISFANKLLDLNLYVGAIRLTGPLTFNNISHYESTTLQETLESTKRLWFQVKQQDLVELDWQFWEEVGVWNDVLVLSTSTFLGANPSDIYKSYTGTNKIIVGDDKMFSLNSYEYGVYSDVTWQSKIASAV